MEKTIISVIGAVVLLMNVQSASAGPISQWYVNSSDAHRIDVIQGNSIVETINTAQSTIQAFPIAVLNTIRTMGSISGRAGAEYALAGTPTGSTYSFGGPANSSYWDGTTDGSYNYAWNFDNGSLVRFDLNWANPTTLFNAGSGSDRLGVTYDPTNDSFWVSGWNLGTIEDYSRSGQLLFSFNSNNAIRGFAMDYADNTLWGLNGLGAATQWSRTGQVLSTNVYSGPVNALGGEFQYTSSPSNHVPEPATAGLLGLGFLGFAASRRKSLKSKNE